MKGFWWSQVVTDFTCQFDQSEEVSVRLSPDADNPVELSVDDVKNLTWDMLVAIWKVSLLLSNRESHVTYSDHGRPDIAGN